MGHKNTSRSHSMGLQGRSFLLFGMLSPSTYMAIPDPPLCVLYHTRPVKLGVFYFANGFSLAKMRSDLAVVACTEYGSIHGWGGYESIDGLFPGPIRFPLQVQDFVSRKNGAAPPGLNSCILMGYLLPSRGWLTCMD